MERHGGDRKIVVLWSPRGTYLATIDSARKCPLCARSLDKFVEDPNVRYECRNTDVVHVWYETAL